MSEGAPLVGMALEAAPAIDGARAAAHPRVRGELLVAAILIAGMWVAAHPYLGVFHDGRLYAVQALHALDPGRFASDLYFRYGSQDSFTLYTFVYKPFVAALGVPAADLAATLFGEALWLASAAWLARTLFKDRTEFLLALAAVILLPAGYGGLGIFHYAEPFPTPRLFAEGLTLLTFALALRRRFALSALALAAAAVLHPLIGLGAAALMALVAAGRDRRVWFLIAAAALAAIALIALRVGPFARALAVYDDAWFHIVRRRCAFGFVSEWRWSDDCQAAASISALCVAWRLATAAERAFIVPLLVVTLGALVLSILGVDVLRDVLMLNLQVWRVLWLTALAANAFIAIVLARAPAGGISREYLAVALAAGVASRFFLPLTVIDPFLLLAALAILQAELRKGAPLAPWLRVLARTGLALAIVAMVMVMRIWATHSLDVLAACVQAAVAVSSGLLLIVLIRRGPTRVLALAGAACLASGLAFADRETPWRAFADSPRVPAGLAAFVPKTGTLYWEGEQSLDLIWFKLRRPNYYSCSQGPGAMFYRRTAFDYARRGAVLRTLGTRDFSDVSSFCEANVHYGQRGPTSPGQLIAACRALPDLDTIVLDRPVPGLAAPSWRAPVAQEPEPDGSVGRVATFYRYSCAALR
ncbi:MAG: hypothetical protein ACREEB_04195 [Caulobacteraceae bacterium]